jgi:hypothetical protein
MLRSIMWKGRRDLRPFHYQRPAITGISGRTRSRASLVHLDRPPPVPNPKPGVQFWNRLVPVTISYACVGNRDLGLLVQVYVAPRVTWSYTTPVGMLKVTSRDWIGFLLWLARAQLHWSLYWYSGRV